MNYADELRGSEGEECRVAGRHATIVAVKDDGAKAVVEFTDDGSKAIYGYRSIQIEGDE